MAAHPRIGYPTRSVLKNLAVSILLTGCLPAVSGACSTGTGAGSASSEVDLVERFTRVVPSERKADADGQFVRHEQVVRNGLAKDAMVLVAPVIIRASLAGFSGRALLEGLSTPVYNVGDGMQMEILLLGRGRERVLYSRYYDAGRRIEDRAWIPIRVPLDLEAWPPDSQLEIRVSGGPQGDLVADWLAVGALHIVQGDAVR